MKIFCFIFARGGSKGLPRKNVKLLSGRPLIQYSIDIAKKINGINEIFVSTDDSEISAVAKKNGAIVIDRPLELAGDKSAEWDSWRHAIGWVEQRYGEFDIFVSLPTTSPLRSVLDVETAITKLIDSKQDVCLAVTPSNRNPYFNMVVRNNTGSIDMVNQPDVTISRRQDAPDVFDITTVVYALRPSYIKNSSSLFTGSVTSVVVPKCRAVDIDDIYDFKLAEAILNEDSI